MVHRQVFLYCWESHCRRLVCSEREHRLCILFVIWLITCRDGMHVVLVQELPRCRSVSPFTSVSADLDDSTVCLLMTPALRVIVFAVHSWFHELSYYLSEPQVCAVCRSLPV